MPNHRPPIWRTFNGVRLNVAAVVATEPVGTTSTGSLSCDWVYSFRVLLTGAEVTMRFSQPKGYGYAGSRHTRESYRADVEAQRSAFIELVESATAEAAAGEGLS